MNLTNVKRWIKASMLREIKKNTGGVHLFVEGDTRDTNKHPQHFEFRLDGPYCKPCGTKGEFRLKVEANILVNSTRNEANLYDRENLQGIASQLLNRDFCIYRTGNVLKVPDVDNETLFGTMQLMPMDEIKISDFGQIDDNVEVYQAVVEAHYEMYVMENSP